MSTVVLEKIIATTNPSNGEYIGSYEYISNEKLEEKIQRCHEAFLVWKQTTPKQRGELIKQIGKALIDNKQRLANMMTKEMGKLISQSIQEIELCKAICDYTADKGVEELKDQEVTLEDGKQGIITYQPIGIVYGIQPWNYPAYQVIRYTIANLMAGNGVLLKHAENVTGTALLLEEIINSIGLPKHLFTALVIDFEQSDSVIENDLVRGVTLTGSPDAGRTVAEKAGQAIKKTVLELGSNDAYIILKDADIEMAVEKCIKGRIYNNGETCIAAKRFIVVEEVYDQFKEAFLAGMKKLKMGDPMNEDVDFGPMAREDLREKLHNQVMKSVQRGANVLCGGILPSSSGYYYPATVLEQVEPDQPAYDDELFGPVASLIKVKDQAEAIKVANDSRFGLGGAIFSEDTANAVEIARTHFDTGMVFINSFGLSTPEMPFGGVKNSGYGREHGGFGVKEFVNAKAIHIG